MSKKTANKAASLRMTAIRTEALSTVSHSAFSEGVSQGEAAKAIFAACGAKPVMALYNAVRDTYITARMAAALPAQGDETEAQRIASAHVLLTKYQGFTGTAKLREGMLGRRSKVQEDAYGAARYAWSKICGKAGVNVPAGTGGGDTSKTRRPQPGKKATAKKAANNNAKRDLSPKVRTSAEAVKHIQTQAKALAAFVSKNAALDIPADYGRAVVAFHKAIFKSVND